MNFSTFIGVDVSKATLDFCCLLNTAELDYSQCPNTFSDVVKLVNQLLQSHQLSKDEVLLCAEYTGHYSNILRDALLSEGFHLWLESPLQIRLSQGIRRGKDDRLDAERIAQYAHRFVDRVKLCQATNPTLEALQYLHSERSLLVNQAAQLKGQLNDHPDFIKANIFRARQKRFRAILKTLDKQIGQLEEQISQLLQQDILLSQQLDLLTSIPGVGQQTAQQVLVATLAFTKFADPRKFCCFVGVAPFKYHSGTSIRSASKVSHRANKKLKSLLHMAAMSAIQRKGELQDYYLRKVAEGKSKMSVLNAVRAKLVHRMFAVIQQNQKYEPFYTNTLA